MIYRVIKFGVGTAYLALIAAMFAFFFGFIQWPWTSGSIAFSAGWLLLTGLSLPTIMSFYFSWFSRLRFQVSFVVGTALLVVASIAGLVSGAAQGVWMGLLGVVAGWSIVGALYRRNRRRFIMTKHGPLPANAWLNPPPQLFKPGDWLIFSGSFGPGKENPAGHAELCLQRPDGVMELFSCWIPKGVVFHDLYELVARWLKRDHYTGLRQREPFSADEIKRSYEIALQMKAENVAYVERVKPLHEARMNDLPLPASWRAKLKEKLEPTGYDFSGLIIGRRADDHWTCIGACLELLQRLGRKVRQYGTGLLGMGTGLFDPLNPARLYDDPSYELLTLDHKAYYEKHGELPPVGYDFCREAA